MTKTVIAGDVCGLPGFVIGKVVQDFTRKRPVHDTRPGGSRFSDTLPVQGTQTPDKHRLFPDGFIPGAAPAGFDPRATKATIRKASA
ncbi:hypothetical protein ACFQ3C_08785 [Seohaeicola saemankumensis]|uniref:Uncharacterized protein n=1 Tax=Seohaeicola saemankumensis TaxID=481181 RepID=A0ABW3TCD6_9RHOB